MQERPLKKTKEAGLPPGTAVYVGKPCTEPVGITLIRYGPEGVEEKQIQQVQDCFGEREQAGVSWINVDGLHDPGVIEEIGEHYAVHSLIVEDIVNTSHRPKLEDHDSYIFLIVKMLHPDDKGGFFIEHIGIVLGPGFVLSFQERAGDVFEPVRQRIRSGKGRIRKSNSDYLTYALVDAIVDNYFVVLENVEERLEGLGERVVSTSDADVAQSLYEIKRELAGLRRSIWPLREVVAGLQRVDPPLVQETTRIFMQDVYDHTIQVMEILDAFREEAAGLRDTYMTNISNRMNEIMKVLTLIATVFIPLTFLAGIYGMNFESMPELKWSWAYPTLLLIMFATVVGMFLFFRRKKWL